MSSTSDFVKKLYKYVSAWRSQFRRCRLTERNSIRMLEDPNFQHVVSWGPGGDCFVVKDMNEFTKSILPRMFKHSNFASFVRQLNKYDFHKVKNTDENQYGEHVSVSFHIARCLSSVPRSFTRRTSVTHVAPLSFGWSPTLGSRMANFTLPFIKFASLDSSYSSFPFLPIFFVPIFDLRT